jgi:hypothetical protein
MQTLIAKKDTTAQPLKKVANSFIDDTMARPRKKYTRKQKHTAPSSNYGGAMGMPTSIPRP